MSTETAGQKPGSRGSRTRTRIMDIAQESILTKGFGATSIDEIVAATDITRSGFFYHFPDKNHLARALLERYIEEDDELFHDLYRRSKELHEDPLHAFLIALKLLSEIFADLPNGHPGCVVATVCYQERLFDAEVRELNRQAILNWRSMFLTELEEIAEKYPPRDDVDLADVADMLSTIIEGGIIVSKAVRDPAILVRQIMMQRSYIKLLFSPTPD